MQHTSMNIYTIIENFSLRIFDKSVNEKRTTKISSDQTISRNVISVYFRLESPIVQNKCQDDSSFVYETLETFSFSKRSGPMRLARKTSNLQKNPVFSNSRRRYMADIFVDMLICHETQIDQSIIPIVNGSRTCSLFMSIKNVCMVFCVIELAIHLVIISALNV